MKKFKLGALAGTIALFMALSFAGTVPVLAEETEDVLVEGLAWDADVVSDTVETEPIYLNNLTVKEVVVESGNDCEVKINGGTIDKVTIAAPQLDVIGFDEIVTLLNLGVSANDVVAMYQNYQAEKEQAYTLKPSIKVNGGAEIDELVVSGSAVLNLAGGDVEEVTVRNEENSGRLLITIQNYDGKLNIDQNPNTDGSNNIVNVKLVNSNLTELNVAGEEKCVFHIGGDSKSDVLTMNVEGSSNVVTLVDTEYVRVTEKAENSYVSIYSDVKNVLVEADNSDMYVASSAIVENARIEGDNVKVSYTGRVDNSEVIGSGSSVGYQAPPTATPIPTATPKPEGTILGNENNTTGWWTVHSDTVKVEEGETEKISFYNFTSGTENWHNFLVVLQNIADVHARTETNGYMEYAVVRADNYGWGDGYSAEGLSSNWNWDTFKSDMNGAYVELSVTNNGTTADVVANITTEAGKTYYQKYIGITITGDLYYCLTVEGGHLIIPDTGETPDEPEAAPTPEPTPVITLAPIPEEFVATGNVLGATDNTTPWWTEFTGTTKVEAGTAARVCFKNYGGAANHNNFIVILQNVADGAEGYAEYAVTRADNWGWGAGYEGIATPESNWNWETFISEMSEATVVLDIVNYGKTADVIATITTSTGEARYQKYLGIAVDGDLYYRLSVDGAHIEFLEPVTEVTPEPTPVVLGAEDFSTAWWQVFSDGIKVEAGTSETVTFKNYTKGEANHQNFVVILKTIAGNSEEAGYREYAVARPDHYGWLYAQNTAENYEELGWTLESNWNWDTFRSDMNGATVELTITNHGTTADIVANITTASGDVHYQKFLGIAVDGDLYYSLTVENAYLVFE